MGSKNYTSGASWCVGKVPHNWDATTGKKQKNMTLVATFCDMGKGYPWSWYSKGDLELKVASLSSLKNIVSLTDHMNCLCHQSSYLLTCQSKAIKWHFSNDKKTIAINMSEEPSVEHTSFQFTARQFTG